MAPAPLYPVPSAATLAVHIKSLRRARGMTQAALGLRLGVKQVRIADIESDPGAVGLDQLLQLLHALDARLLLADQRPDPAQSGAGAAAPLPSGDDW